MFITFVNDDNIAAFSNSDHLSSPFKWDLRLVSVLQCSPRCNSGIQLLHMQDKSSFHFKHCQVQPSYANVHFDVFQLEAQHPTALPACQLLEHRIETHSWPYGKCCFSSQVCVWLFFQPYTHKHTCRQECDKCSTAVQQIQGTHLSICNAPQLFINKSSGQSCRNIAITWFLGSFKHCPTFQLLVQFLRCMSCVSSSHSSFLNYLCTG